jgi:hypothetical protein
MAERLLKEVYKTPRVQIRGVFLCEDVAVPVSVFFENVTQDDWGSGETLVGNGTDERGDVWVKF